MRKADYIYALVTGQGTAAAETALCDKHLQDDEAAKLALANAGEDVARGTLDSLLDRSAWIDCTGNEALACIVCSARAY